MSTEIARVEFTPDQIALVKRTIARDLSDDELNLFLAQCRRTGLDPFARQIHVTRRNGKMVIQTAIDGYRLIADRTERYAGSDDPIFDNETQPKKATVTVYKIVAGVRCPFTASARWNEYYPGEKLGFMWDKMPCVMLGKCAEALALRKAFPQDLSGIYTDEEMDQAGAVATPAVKQLADVSRDPLSTDGDDRARLRSAPTLGDLAAVWASIPPDRQKRLLLDKDRRKAELATAPQPEGEQRADFQPACPPAKATPSPTESPSAGDDPPRAGGAIVQVLIGLMHQLDVNWAQIRDGVDRGATIAAAVGLPQMPVDFRITDLLATQALALKTHLEALVAEKKARSARRAEAAKRREAEEVAVTL